MTIQKDKFQTYTAALQNDLCTLRDAIELVHTKHSTVRAIRLSFGNHAPKEMAKAEIGLKNSVEAAVKVARGE